MQLLRKTECLTLQRFQHGRGRMWAVVENQYDSCQLVQLYREHWHLLGVIWIVFSICSLPRCISNWWIPPCKTCARTLRISCRGICSATATIRGISASMASSMALPQCGAATKTAVASGLSCSFAFLRSGSKGRPKCSPVIIIVSCRRTIRTYREPTFFARCYAAYNVGTVLQAVLSISGSNSSSESLFITPSDLMRLLNDVMISTT